MVQVCNALLRPHFACRSSAWCFVIVRICRVSLGSTWKKPAYLFSRSKDVLGVLLESSPGHASLSASIVRTASRRRALTWVPHCRIPLSWQARFIHSSVLPSHVAIHVEERIRAVPLPSNSSSATAGTAPIILFANEPGIQWISWASSVQCR